LDKYDKTHRCKKLLNSIRKCAIRYFSNKEDPGWYIFVLENDFDWDSVWLSCIAKIEHCPFCGEELI